MKTLGEYVVGEIEKFGSYRVTRDEVIEFASRYDPQSFHLDDLAAAANPFFGRIAASGWHTAAASMRMIVDHGRTSGKRALGSPGVKEMEWPTPTYPGDTLSIEAEVIEARPSKTRPTVGLVLSRSKTLNQHGEVVMSMIATTFVPIDPV